MWGNAGKLMGLSAYGKKVASFPDLIKVRGGDTIILKNGIYSFFKQLGLKPDNIKSSLNGCVRAVIFRMLSGSPIGKDLAYKAQEELESAMLRITGYIHEKTGCENLCLAGGVALNCVANGKIVRNSGFKNIFVQPGGMDDGTSIGLAFYGWHQVLKKQKRFVLKNAFLGVPYGNSDLLSFLEQRPYDRLKKYFRKHPDTSRLAASLVAAGKTVAWFQGASEFGPRALGHRSILADPRREEFKVILNDKKGREQFRPFAASVLAEKCAQYFDLDVPSPFMLIAAPVKESQRRAIPAVVHVDGTTRIQTVTEEGNRAFYCLIKEFRKLTGLPLVLNTSFNAKNEPLVETPAEAVRSFFAMGLDCLVINDYVLERAKVPAGVVRDAGLGEGFGAKNNRLSWKAISKAHHLRAYTKNERKELIDLRVLKAHYYTEQRQYAKALREYKDLMALNPDIPELKKRIRTEIL